MEWYFQKKHQVVSLGSDHCPFSFEVARGVSISDQLAIEHAHNGKIYRVATASGTQIYPEFKEKISFKHPTLGIRASLNFWLAKSESDVREANSLIERVHYEKAVNRGVYLCASFEDIELQKQLRKVASRSYSRDLYRHPDSWKSKLGGIVGCVVIDRLYFGLPLGREIIRKASRRARDFLETHTRDQIVNQLKVSWIRRIAVDQPYQFMGIGTMLCQTALSVGKSFISSPARWLEVIRSEKKEVAEKIIGKDRPNFLTKAGFVPFHLATRRSKMCYLDGSGSERRSNDTYVRIYYCART